MNTSQSFPHLTLQLKPMKVVPIDALPQGIIPSSLPSKVLNHKILLRNRQRNRQVHEWLEKPQISSRSKTETDHHSHIFPRQKPLNPLPNVHIGYKPLLASQPPLNAHYFVPNSDIIDTTASGSPTTTARVSNRKIPENLFQKTKSCQLFKSELEAHSINNSGVQSPRLTAFQKTGLTLSSPSKDTSQTFLSEKQLQHRVLHKEEFQEYVPLSFRSLPRAYFSPANKDITKENRYTQQALALVRPIVLTEEDSQSILEVKPVKTLEDITINAQKSSISSKKLKSITTVRKTTSLLSFVATKPIVSIPETNKQEKSDLHLKSVELPSVSLIESPNSKAVMKSVNVLKNENSNAGKMENVLPQQNFSTRKAQLSTTRRKDSLGGPTKPSDGVNKVAITKLPKKTKKLTSNDPSSLETGATKKTLLFSPVNMKIKK